MRPIFLLLALASSHAQTVGVQLNVGLPVSGFKANDSPFRFGSVESFTNRYIAGVFGELLFGDKVGFEIGALYRRTHVAGETRSVAVYPLLSSRAAGGAWLIPLIDKVPAHAEHCSSFRRRRAVANTFGIGRRSDYHPLGRRPDFHNKGFQRDFYCRWMDRRWWFGYQGRKIARISSIALYAFRRVEMRSMRPVKRFSRPKHRIHNARGRFLNCEPSRLRWERSSVFAPRESSQPNNGVKMRWCASITLCSASRSGLMSHWSRSNVPPSRMPSRLGNM